jgi:hypothetical protein
MEHAYGCFVSGTTAEMIEGRQKRFLKTKEPTMTTTSYRAVQASNPGRLEVVEREGLLMLAWARGRAVRCGGSPHASGGHKRALVD